jgi:hypothetical protein
MQVTLKMIETMKDYNPAARNIGAGLEAVLRDVPDVVPFTFAGYPDHQVFLHPCGTVVDVAPGSDTEADVRAGACDCENTSPWMRIYVEKEQGR